MLILDKFKEYLKEMQYLFLLKSIIIFINNKPKVKLHVLNKIQNKRSIDKYQQEFKDLKEN